MNRKILTADDQMNIITFDRIKDANKKK